MQQQLQESRRYIAHYARAQEVAGISHDDFITFNFTHAVLGSSPYIIALDRYCGGVGWTAHGLLHGNAQFRSHQQGHWGQVLSPSRALLSPLLRPAGRERRWCWRSGGATLYKIW